MCRQIRNPFDEAALFSSLQEALRWAIDTHPPQVQPPCSYA